MFDAQSGMKDNYTENEHVKLWIEDGILFTVYKPNLEITLEVAKKIVHERLQLAQNQTFSVLFDMRELKSADKEARTYLARHPEANRGMSASALLVDNQVVKLIGNFFIKMDKPIIPTKMFSDLEDAVNWLKPFRNLN